MAGKRIPLHIRFWKKVDTSLNQGPNGACWEWKGKTAGMPGFQYGMIHLGGTPTKLIQATHVAWFIETGEWPTDQMLHRCDNPLCVRVSHLWHGTQKDNMVDCETKGRSGPHDTRTGCKHTPKTKEKMSIARRKYWKRKRECVEVRNY